MSCVHTLTVLCTICAVPELALLLVSGVLECWKHLTGRFNIQLTRSQTSYITAENPTLPPTPTQSTPQNLHPLPSSLYPGFFPIRCPSLWSDLHPSPLSPLLPASLSSVFVWAARGRTDSSAALSVHQSSCWLHLIWMDCFSFGGYCLPPPFISLPTPTPQARLWSAGLVLRW